MWAERVTTAKIIQFDKKENERYSFCGKFTQGYSLRSLYPYPGGTTQCNCMCIWFMVE